MAAPIRILADRSKDAREGMVFTDLKPSVAERPASVSPAPTTDCR